MGKSEIPTKAEVVRKIQRHFLKAVLCNSLSDAVELIEILNKESELK